MIIDVFRYTGMVSEGTKKLRSSYYLLKMQYTIHGLNALQHDSRHLVIRIVLIVLYLFFLYFCFFFSLFFHFFSMCDNLESIQSFATLLIINISREKMVVFFSSQNVREEGVMGLFLCICLSLCFLFLLSLSLMLYLSFRYLSFVSFYLGLDRSGCYLREIKPLLVPGVGVISSSTNRGKWSEAERKNYFTHRSRAIRAFRFVRKFSLFFSIF